MKSKLLKKITILGITSLGLLVPTVIKAENVCTIHKNYYLYGLISEAPNLVYSVYESEPTIFYHAAYFPMLPKDAEPTEGQRDILKGRVCLQKGDKIDGDATLNQCNFGVWTVEKFYQKRYSMVQNSTNFKSEQFVDKSGKTRTISVYIEKNTNEDGKPEEIRYYSGADWFRCGNSECREEGNESKSGVNAEGADINNLIAATYLPSETIIEFNPAVSNLTTAKRTISVGKTNKDDSDFFDYLEYDDTKVKVGSDGRPIINPNSQILKPISIIWKQGENARNSLLAPAVYYVEYQTCKDLYKATINYYYYKEGNVTTERVKLDNGTEKEPYHNNSVEDGKGETVVSPTIKHCAIVDENGRKNDADKVITYTINGEDYSHNVYYRCDAYDATINYYYYKDGKITTDKVDFGKDVKNPYTETGFLPGETKDVISPEKKGCTIVDTKGNKNDADKIVTIAIDKNSPKDFTKEVYYYCPTEVNPKTGDALIYLAWTIGLGAIGYSVYYFKKAKKEEA